MIRRFQTTDLNQIISIYNQVKLDRSQLSDSKYTSNIQKNGYLLGLDTPDEIHDEIKNSYITLVYVQKGEILGYLIADHSDKQKFMDDEYKTWFDESLKNKYYNSPKCMTLAVIAVTPGLSQHHVATDLLQHLESILIDNNFSHLFSIVNISPITNCASIIWHTKNSFIRLGMSRPRSRMLELDWYSSLLFFKNL